MAQYFQNEIVTCFLNQIIDFKQLCITLQKELEWLLALVSPPSWAWPPKKQAAVVPRHHQAQEVQVKQPDVQITEAAADVVPRHPQAHEVHQVKQPDGQITEAAAAVVPLHPQAHDVQVKQPNVQIAGAAAAVVDTLCTIVQRDPKTVLIGRYFSLGKRRTDAILLLSWPSLAGLLAVLWLPSRLGILLALLQPEGTALPTKQTNITASTPQLQNITCLFEKTVNMSQCQPVIY